MAVRQAREGWERRQGKEAGESLRFAEVFEAAEDGGGSTGLGDDETEGFRGGGPARGPALVQRHVLRGARVATAA